jgi:hypothetical protein
MGRPARSIEEAHQMASVDERIAEIEGKMASSWALKTRAEYEGEFRERVKNEVLAHATKLAIAALIFLSGAGYLLIKSVVTDVYQSENQKLVADLKARYDNNLAEERARFEWKRYHDYGKSYVYLAGQDWNSGALDDQRKKSLVGTHFPIAKTYFMYAMRADPQQATTYWELGELHYSYAKKFEQPDWISVDKALHYYEQAAKLYTQTEIASGWRADAYRLIGKIYYEKAQAAAKPEADKYLAVSRESFNNARSDYVKAIPESRDYNKDGLTEVDDMLVKLGGSPAAGPSGRN